MKSIKQVPGWNIYRSNVEKFVFRLLAIMVALLVGVLVIHWFGKNPWQAYRYLINGAFGSWTSFGETLVYVSPLILTGLSIAVAFRCGLFNIGAEGQYIMGMMGAAWMGAAFSGLPPLLHIPLTMLTGALAGALWGAFPGFFKAKFGAHEVISTIMLNYTALHLAGFLVNRVLIAPPGTSPVTRIISDSAKLTRLLPPSRAHAGIFVALGFLAIIYLFLWKTKWGYEIRAVGFNKEAARYAGMNVTRNIVLAMVVSGGLAGLSGALQIQGLQYRFVDLFGFPGYGFDGIAVALLGNNHPLGVLGGAILFGAMNCGALQMQSLAGIPKYLIGVMQAMIILFIGADYLLKKWKPQRNRAARNQTGGVQSAGKEAK